MKRGGNKSSKMITLILLLLLCPLLLSCGQAAEESAEIVAPVFENVDPVDNEQVQQEQEKHEQVQQGQQEAQEQQQEQVTDVDAQSVDSTDDSVYEAGEALEPDDPEAAAYFDGGWGTWGSAGGDDVSVPRAYYEIKDGYVYEYCIPSMATGKYSACSMDPIRTLERLSYGYRIRVGDESRQTDGYTLETSDKNPNTLFFYGTWDENHFGEHFSGTSSLDRDADLRYISYSDEIREIVSSLKNPVSFIKDAASELVDHKECVAPYRDVLEAAKADGMAIGYYLVDITGDDVPELLIYESDCHAAKVHIYSMNNGEINDIGEYGEWC